MVAVVAAVSALLFQRLVLMLMGVRLGQVQHDTRQHQDTTARHQPSGGSVPQQDGQGRLDNAPTIAAPA
ncbi:MAG TPA: hypothetical protein VFY73_10875 [Ideonella sp.]|nr:hypothetical protein [Ideonella sp.]